MSVHQTFPLMCGIRTRFLISGFRAVRKSVDYCRCLQSRFSKLDVWALRAARRGVDRKQRHGLVEIRLEG